MKTEYLNFYNNLIKLTTNKSLYLGVKSSQDSFSDRMILFLLHFAFILKEFKNKENDKKLQELYDFNFRQLELTIREIGYGDQSINKKMKIYINLFHSIIDNIHFWDELKKTEKIEKLSIFLEDFDKIEDLLVYFEGFRINLSKKNLNLLLKGVSTF